jgi:hypothetical protein
MDELSLAAGAPLDGNDQQAQAAVQLVEDVYSQNIEMIQPAVSYTDTAALVFGGMMCALVLWATRSRRERRQSSSSKDDEYDKLESFKRRYLAAYLLAFFADWSMGAYIYTLYSSYYHYSMGAIAHLFIVGFGSALIVGTYLGMFAAQPIPAPDCQSRRRIMLRFSKTQETILLRAPRHPRRSTGPKEDLPSVLHPVHCRMRPEELGQLHPADGMLPSSVAQSLYSPIRSTARGKMWAALPGTFCIGS